MLRFQMTITTIAFVELFFLSGSVALKCDMWCSKQKRLKTLSTLFEIKKFSDKFSILFIWMLEEQIPMNSDRSVPARLFLSTCLSVNMSQSIFSMLVANEVKMHPFSSTVFELLFFSCSFVHLEFASDDFRKFIVFCWYCLPMATHLNKTSNWNAMPKFSQQSKKGAGIIMRRNLFVLLAFLSGG